MTDAPLPMTIAEAIVVAEHIQSTDALSPVQKRAVEVLVRVARRTRSSSVSHVDTVSKLIAVREQLEEAKIALDTAISTATTSQTIEQR